MRFLVPEISSAPRSNWPFIYGIQKESESQFFLLNLFPYWDVKAKALLLLNTAGRSKNFLQWKNFILEKRIVPNNVKLYNIAYINQPYLSIE